MNATQLTCEYAQNPIGLDTPAPRFGWTLDATGRGASQAAYRVLVASSAEQLDASTGDKWDSGKVEAGRSVNRGGNQAAHNQRTAIAGFQTDLIKYGIDFRRV